MVSKSVMEFALSQIEQQYCKVVKVNFNANTFEIGVADDDEWKQAKTNDELWDGFAKSKYIYKDDVEGFIDFYTTRDKLKFVYRRLVKGEYHWVYLELVPTVNFSEYNEEYIAYIKDINDIYISEHDAIVNMIGITDSQTGLLNRLAFYKYLQKFNGDFVGMMACDINCLRYTNQHLGRTKGDELIQTFANLLKEDFGDCKCYHLCCDEFMVISEDEHFSKRAKSFLRKVWSMEVPIASVGYSTGININEVREECEADMYDDKVLFYAKYPKYNM